jgi:hypothetical protein
LSQMTLCSVKSMWLSHTPLHIHCRCSEFGIQFALSVAPNAAVKERWKREMESGKEVVITYRYYGLSNTDHQPMFSLFHSNYEVCLWCLAFLTYIYISLCCRVTKAGMACVIFLCMCNNITPTVLFATPKFKPAYYVSRHLASIIILLPCLSSVRLPIV